MSTSTATVMLNVTVGSTERPLGWNPPIGSYVGSLLGAYGVGVAPSRPDSPPTRSPTLTAIRKPTEPGHLDLCRSRIR